MQFLNHMRLSAKFLLLGILALLMVALPTGLYFQHAWGGAAFARQEASGRDAVVALNRTIQTLQSPAAWLPVPWVAMSRWHSADPPCATKS